MRDDNDEESLHKSRGNKGWFA